MNDTIKIWENPEFGTVRTVEINGEPWLVGKDVAETLGYSNPQKAIRDHVDEEDRTVNESFTVNGTMATLINESGLYALVFRSKLPWAKKFQHWVTSEVLPSIRKNGMYAIDDLINNPELGVRAFTALMEERQLFRRPGLTLQDVARELGSNTRYVSTCINDETGKSFPDYINSYRVKFAQRLLKSNPGRPLSGVAEESGFSSESSFFRNFKALTGKTPNQWLMER